MQIKKTCIFKKEHIMLTDNFLMFLQRTERSEFLSFFYRHNMHVLTAPVLAVTATDELTGKGKNKGNFEKGSFSFS